MLRNLKVSKLSTLQSPRYYTVFAGFDVNGDQFPFSDRVGNIGRNTYRGDLSYTTDVRVQRLFKLSEWLIAEAGAEVFNLFNRQNVNGIDTVYGAAALLGPTPQKFGDGITSPANPTFGSPNFVAPARQVQVFLRLDFNYEQNQLSWLPHQSHHLSNSLCEQVCSAHIVPVTRILNGCEKRSGTPANPGWEGGRPFSSRFERLIKSLALAPCKAIG